MKKRYTIAIITLIIATLFQNVPNTKKEAYAESDKYLRITTEDTPFYSDKDGENFMFYLQYTYYVKVLNRGTAYTQVEYYGDNGRAVIDGYVPTGLLFDDGLSVENPYPNVTLTTAVTAVLYADEKLSVVTQYLFSGRELKYYGYIENEGEKAYFVSYNNRLGYVKETEIIPFVIPNHPNELTFLIKDEPTEKEPENQPTATKETPASSTNNTETLRILIICCLGFAGIVALFIAFKPRTKQTRHTDYYDENDYE